MVEVASLKTSPREKRAGDDLCRTQALAPRSTQGHCTMCCPFQANRRPTPPTPSPPQLLSAPCRIRGSHSSPRLLERFKESDAPRSFLSQCDTSDFSPWETETYPQFLGLGLCALNSSLY